MKLFVWLTVFLAIIVHITKGYRTLSSESLEKIAQRSKPDALDIANGGRLLNPFLVERVSGTESNAKVRNMIIQHFTQLDWNIELDTFTDDTPLGKKEFTNIIVTKQPEAGHRLVLAAHYDSLDKQGFIGATDSAVPCALLLSLAETLNDQLGTDSEWSGGRRQSSSPQDMTTLELVFFDGEEAFVQWSAEDSIYGARHLAAKWAKTPGVGSKSRLQAIDVLVLLDLLGTSNPTFHDYFESTSWLYKNLANLESRLASSKFWQKGNTMLPTGHTLLRYQSNAMSDDHVPFKDRGVNILHLIPYPFPSEWHTSSDNAACLDPPTISNLDILFRAFVCEYLELVPVPHGEL